MKETQSHLIVMQHRLGELMPEYQVTIINLINHLASHNDSYREHAMRRIEKISNENPYVDEIEGFEKLLIDEETCPEDEE
tara:strand:+ start:310 stop:549 length:240 start_codon:yes stop_codon:yes gene_type:complete